MVIPYLFDEFNDEFSEEQSDEHFMKQALRQAEIALEQGEVPCGAVIVANNQVIAKGYNQIETLNDSTAHAEMIALTSAFNYFGAKYLPDCTLYVTLEPCVMCGGALYWSQIARVVYGASDPKRGYTHLNQNVLHPRTKLTCGILATQSSHLLSTFFTKIRRK